MADIFFIYAEEDAHRVREVCAALGRAGLACDPSREVPPGTTYSAYCAERIAKADAVAVFWSAAAVAQPRVLDEAAAARDAGKVAPATLDGTLPPLGFRQIQTANLDGWPGEAAQNALGALAAALGGLAGAKVRTRARQRTAHRPFLGTWKFWLLSLLVAAGIGALAFLSPEGRGQLGQGLNERVAQLAVYVVLALIFTPASRALLHASRRVIGLDSRAFFSAGYLVLLAVSLGAGAGAVEYYRAVDPSSPAASASLMMALCSGATLLPAPIALLVFLVSALRRLIFGRAKGA